MTGTLGGYAMTQDASGTSWQPASTPMEGMHGALGNWTTMIHGFANLIYDSQGGPRGDTDTFSQSMVMGMAQRDYGASRVTLRAMLSLDPLMGDEGYPLLLQTGETADGVTPLIDRQHPHDFFMELAGIYSHRLSETSSAYLYLGYPGEPALGPPTFMHRFSGVSNPEAPLGHHWLDATHITFGVATLGYVFSDWKIEGSLFSGREPDQHRWDFDDATFDSASTRVSWNPTDDLSFQVSYGFLKSPEQLEANKNQHRLTASATYNRKLANGNWQTTFAWGRNNLQPGPELNAYLLETAYSWDRHTIFGRAENDQKNELFADPHPLHGTRFDISKLSLGYIYDIPVAEHVSLGLGGLVSAYALPKGLDPFYGSDPMSTMLFARVKIL